MFKTADALWMGPGTGLEKTGNQIVVPGAPVRMETTDVSVYVYQNNRSVELAGLQIQIYFLRRLNNTQTLKQWYV